MNLLIFKVNQLGDNVVFLPVVQTLRRLYPSWKIFLLTSPVAASLYEADIPAEQMLVVPTRDFLSAWRRPRKFSDLLTRIRRLKLDACLLAEDQGHVAHALARLSGAPARIGSQMAVLKFSPMLTTAVPLPKNPHAATIAWDLGRALVTELGDGNWPARPSAPDLGHLIGGRQPVAGRIVIHPGGSAPYQRWPVDRFAELARRLARQHEVCWIEPAEIAPPVLAPEIRRFRPSTIAELVQLLASASLFVGNNSGPMNLVFALGRPAVIVNGPSLRLWDPFWYPERVQMLLDSTLPCLPCDSYRGPAGFCRNTLAPMTCLDRWTLDQVENACRHWHERWAAATLA